MSGFGKIKIAHTNFKVLLFKTAVVDFVGESVIIFFVVFDYTTVRRRCRGHGETLVGSHGSGNEGVMAGR